MIAFCPSACSEQLNTHSKFYCLRFAEINDFKIAPIVAHDCENTGYNVVNYVYSAGLIYDERPYQAMEDP